MAIPATNTINVGGKTAFSCGWRHLIPACDATQCGNREVLRRGAVDRVVHAPPIDEIYVGKTNKFFTIVIDWMSGAIVYVGDGKGEKALNRFWKRLRGSKAKIRAVATDMAGAYYAATRKNLPDAKHVFDRFPIVKLMNEKLTRRCRELRNEADKTGKNVLKGLRWLLLKFSGDLEESKKERSRLMDALDLNQSLAIVYYLKEDLAQIWQQRDKATADRFQTDWCARARASGIQVLQPMGLRAGRPQTCRDLHEPQSDVQ